MFPLPNGSVSIFLEPAVDDDGSLILTSPISQFGDNGAYLIVRQDAHTAAVRRAPLAEKFRVHATDEGTLYVQITRSTCGQSPRFDSTTGSSEHPAHLPPTTDALL